LNQTSVKRRLDVQMGAMAGMMFLIRLVLVVVSFGGGMAGE
jgi:hypothetical protein